MPISKAGQVRASFSLVRLRCLRRHVSWSGVSRYLIGLAMVAIALAAFQADEYPSFSSEFYVIFTFVALFTTMLFGARGASDFFASAASTQSRCATARTTFLIRGLSSVPIFVSMVLDANACRGAGHTIGLTAAVMVVAARSER